MSKFDGKTFTNYSSAQGRIEVNDGLQRKLSNNDCVSLISHSIQFDAINSSVM